MASGSPSSRRLSATRSATLPAVDEKPGRTAAARSTSSRTAGSVSSGASGQMCSPRNDSGVRLVTSAVSRGQRTSSPARSPAAPATCSKLSSTSTQRPSEMIAATASAGSCPMVREPSAAASAGSTSSAPGNALRSTPAAPSRPPASRQATSWASRLLPTPPGPVTVTSRTLRSRASLVTAARSASRPTSELTGAGSPMVVRRAGRRVTAGGALRASRTNSARAAPVSSRASASARAVSRCGRRVVPRSRSPIVRTPTALRSASCSWDRPRATRSSTIRAARSTGTNSMAGVQFPPAFLPIPPGSGEAAARTVWPRIA